MSPDGREAAHGQRAHGVRLEWGATGAAAIAAGADVAVVVDVLSFTTTLTVALEQGMVVLPYRWKDARAAAYAQSCGAVLAVGRSEQRAAAPGATVSLSPAAMAARAARAGSRGERVVLPSPNGSAISFGLREAGLEVVGACLRNRTAVGRWLAARVAAGAVVAVVPAGERWRDGSLRPAAEDLWGAGAVVDAVLDAGSGVRLSPEAELARDAFLAVRDRLPERLLACAGGQELAAIDFAADVEVAAELDVSDVVPVLGEDGFRDASTDAGEPV